MIRERVQNRPPSCSPHGRTRMIVFAGRRSGRLEGGEGISGLRRPRRASSHGAEKSASVSEGCRGGHRSGGLPHCCALVIVDDVPPDPVRATAHDIACRTSKVDTLAVRTCTFD